MKKLILFIVVCLVFSINLAGSVSGAFPDSADRISGHLSFAYYIPWHATPEKDGFWAVWDDTGHKPWLHDLRSMYWPYYVPYSNSDPEIYRKHAQFLRRANIDVPIIGWENNYRDEEQRVEDALKYLGQNGFKSIICIYPRWSGESWNSLIERLDTVVWWATEKYPNYYFHSNGKPVFMVGYPDRDDLIHNPDWPTLFESWKWKINHYKTALPNSCIFVARDCQLDWLKDSYWDGWSWAGCPNDPDHLGFNLWKVHSVDNYNRFYIQGIIAGFDDRNNCHNPNPKVIDRENGNFFKKIFDWTINADWNGYRIDHVDVAFNDHGEGAGIYPVVSCWKDNGKCVTPHRDLGYESCGGRVPQEYLTYKPLDDFAYLDICAHKVDEFKNSYGHPCSCSPWTNQGCGSNGCSSSEMHQTRTCTPSGCDIKSRCVYDPRCENQLPVADADGPYTVLENHAIQLDGTGSYDTDGSIASYTWSGRCAPYLDDVHKSRPTFTAPEVSSDTNYACTLTVADDDGATDSDTTTITVKDCTCSPWTNQGCGLNGCSPTEMHQTRTCTPSGCDNETQCVPDPVTCDTQPPITRDNLEANTWHGEMVLVSLTCTDTGSGCKDTYYCVYDTDETGNEGSCTPATRTDPNSNFTIACGSDICYKKTTYYSTDNAGNAESYRTSTLIKMDSSVPVCTMNSLDEYTNKTQITLSWSGTSTGSEITEYTVQYKIDDENYQTLGTFKTTSTEFTGEENHAYAFRCKTKNELGKESPWSPEVKTFIDTTPPESYINPLPEYLNKTRFLVEWSSSSDVSFYSVQFKDTEWAAFYEGSSASKEFANAENNKTYSFRAKATDPAGNTGEWSDIVSTTIDTSKPTCEINPLLDVQTNNIFTVSWSGYDASGIDYYEVQYKEGTGNWNPLPGLYKTTQTSYQFTALDGKRYHFVCRATDPAGNTGEWSDIVSTTIDTSPPDIKINCPDKISKGDNALISATIHDITNIFKAYLMMNDTQIQGTINKQNETTWEAVWVIPHPDLGSYTLLIYAEDNNSNFVTKTFSFTVVPCQEGATRPCSETKKGICGTGNETCTNGEWVGCPEPVKERCNGEDDNCDGIIDNIDGKTSVQETKCQCYNGNQPKTETCNEIDDDCDGETDEGLTCCLTGETRRCGTDVGICEYGTETCINGKWSGVCEGGVKPGEEICENNKDDDCDGITDEMRQAGVRGPACKCMEGSTKPCGSDTGICEHGIQTCINGVWGECTGGKEPETEICWDKLDNDCDGYADADDPDCEGKETNFNWIGIIISFIGIAILGVLGYLWWKFKKQGKELTWEALMKKWKGK